MIKRISAIAVAAFAAAALVGPSSALAGGSHLLGMYKVEKHIDIEGEDGTYTISCNPGDIAVDGMWRLDNYDQDNDYAYEALHSTPAWYDVQLALEPTSAYSSAIDTYTFEFVPLAGGDVQGKLFLTCLPLNVVTYNGHTHAWVVASATRVDQTPDPLVGPASWPNGVSGDANQTTACPSTSLAIAPGFRWVTNASPAAPTYGGYGKVVRREPNSYAAPTKWNWTFVTSSPDVQRVQISYRCLPYKSGTTNGHAHRIVASGKYKVIPPSIPKNSNGEVQAICGEHYKAMLGGWNFKTAPVFAPGHFHWWYLGMDPRPKARAFKVLNTDPVNAWAPTTSQFGVVCFKDRTT
jgi:hypothetical protein